MAGFGSIKRAADMQTGPIQHMRINHCGSDVFVPEQFLNATDVVPAFKQMRGDEWEPSVKSTGGSKVNTGKRLAVVKKTV